MESGGEAGGGPVVGWTRHPGLTVHYISGQHFEVGVALRNKSRSPVTVTGVRVVEPPRTLVRQTGTLMTLWNPPACHHFSCPAPAFPIRPTTTAPQRPVEVGAGLKLGVGLAFRLRPCVDSASSAAPSHVEVAFHVRGGPTQRQVLSLGGSRLVLRGPIPGCRLRG
jgi:hypothetical protein